ncbi:Cobyrinic acid ac-diamide synthase [Desulfotomaculum nigrificans CO-1-SRB]|uniref:Cobyrinic acid ac-diamide synthase n=1 Tax=Desulfotomaculum nigrificans (strain DSM 14880 / VKM B-2319 / CO-1-SRB) TaxID=868595 RepID=F6B7Z0_DESCC|nr:MinD/ParA family protein [Desulfotomaculum nigrificans]AEF94627.1 Cobyrinic acid ac-diamide synthase [Desulfotomaculum nigrificans CO-1-SRB]
MRSPKLNLERTSWGPGDSGSRVIAVASGKGGVGKTNLVVNLAVELRRRGKRVAIFDADLGMANAEVLLGIVPQYTMYDFLFKGKSIKDIMVCAEQGIYVISGGSGFLELANLDSRSRQRLSQCLQELEDDFDYILVDTGAGISKTVLGFVAAADEVIVVITPEPTSLTDAYGLIKILAKYHVHDEIMVTVNRAADEKEAQRTFKRLELTASRFLQIKLINLGFIPEDHAVVRAVKNQQPFMIMNPSSWASQNLARITDYLVLDQGGPPAGLNGFLDKLMRLFGQGS